MTSHTELGLATSGRCCSDLLLDRYLVGELADDERLSLATHLEGSPRCQSRLEVLRDDRALFQQQPSTMPYALPSAAAEDVPPTMLPSRWRRMMVAVPVLAAAAAVVVSINTVDTGTRTKGSGAPSLAVHVQRGGQVHQAAAGLQAGDTIQFTVRTSRPGYAAVVSVDPNQQASAYAPPRGAMMAIAAGEQQLPFATQLDDSVGVEQLHLFVCDEAHDVSDLVAKTQANDVAMSGCSVTTTTMTKGAAPR
jgi:hypothetical protein